MARHVRTLVLAMLALAGTRVHAGWFFKDKLVEAFLQPATVREASLSPDGTHLAVIGIAADDDDISTCLLLVDTDTAESHMIRRPEATADADNPGARYYMRQPISVAWMTYRWQSCDRSYRSQPCFLQAALCLCPRAQKCETGDDLTPARLRLWRDRAALNKLRQGRDETAAAAGMCAGRRYAGPCGCRCRARILRGRASSASDRAQVVAHDASRRTPWPRYASCLGLHRTDLEDDMPRQEPIHPMPAFACEALSASGVIRP
jgi:hypothetical protein